MPAEQKAIVLSWEPTSGVQRVAVIDSRARSPRLSMRLIDACISALACRNDDAEHAIHEYLHAEEGVCLRNQTFLHSRARHLRDNLAGFRRRKRQ